jgi:uncharacterized membrane protein YdbT with pleckstrin-like domain
MVEEYLTPSQKETLENKPQGHIPNSFPREFLNKDEKVIYEGRPSIVPYVTRPIILGVIYTIILGLPVLIFLGPIGLGVFGIVWFLFILFVTLILPLIFSILRWSRTYYAMTDRRVTHTYGLFSRMSSDIPLDKVMNILMLQPFTERIFGYGTIVFTTAGAGGIMKLSSFYKQGAVVWRAIKYPLQVKNYVQEVTDIIQKAQKAKEFKEMAKAMKEKE